MEITLFLLTKFMILRMLSLVIQEGTNLLKALGEGKLTDLFMDLNLLSQWNQQEFTVIPQQV